MNRGRRAELAAETLSISQADGYHHDGRWIALGIQASIDGSRVVPAEDPCVRKSRRTGRASRVWVTGETTLEAGERLVAAGAGRVGCLNFASGRNPGGGFLKGASAQEESLARNSGLYLSLIKFDREYYQRHNRIRTGLYSHTMIVSPDVPVFRREVDGALLASPYRVTFITSAAVNMGVVASRREISAERASETQRERIRRVLVLAEEQDIRTLVLGAWGCGCFRQEPAAVARMFREELAAFSGAFDDVVFAILDRQGDTLAAFRAELT